jgi:hypothetical protein
MSTALNNNSTRPTVPGTVAISDDEMHRFAPSVFASQPIEGVSERYSFLPTSSILKGMRENGWVPVRAQEQSIRTEARRGFQKHVVRFARAEGPLIRESVITIDQSAANAFRTTVRLAR